MAAFYEKKSEKIFFQASFHGYSLNIDKQSLKKTIINKSKILQLFKTLIDFSIMASQEQHPIYDVHYIDYN